MTEAKLEQSFEPARLKKLKAQPLAKDWGGRCKHALQQGANQYPGHPDKALAMARIVLLNKCGSKPTAQDVQALRGAVAQPVPVTAKKTARKKK